MYLVWRVYLARRVSGCVSVIDPCMEDYWCWGNSSVVERWIPVPAVGGSIPSSLTLCSFEYLVFFVLLPADDNLLDDSIALCQLRPLRQPVDQRKSANSPKSAILLDLCVSSLRRGHANLLCIVPIFTDDHRSGSCRLTRLAPISGRLRHHIQNHFCNNRSKNTRLRERSRLFQSKGLSLQRFVVSHHNKLERARVLSRWNVQEEKRQL